METSRTPAFPPLGRQPRGVQASDVERVADALLRAGERPTVEKVRVKLGSGSPNTINPLLDAWWQRLASRIEVGPKALERLPEEVIHAAESLWLDCLEMARQRARHELGNAQASVDRTGSEQVRRAEVLRLRELELKARLSDRDKTIAVLESEAKAFAALFKKEQAKSVAEAQRFVAMQAELDSLRKLLTSLSVRTVHKQRSVQRSPATTPKKAAAKTTKAKHRLKSAPGKKRQSPQARSKAKRITRPRS